MNTSSNSSSEIFTFEKDFAGALYCIPMAVRRKLDLCGVKVSLKQWNRFELDEREQMVAQDCETPNEIDTYGRYVVGVIEQRTDDAAQLLERDAGTEWNDPKSVPQRVLDYSMERDVTPPTVAQWAALSPLQRFSIFKLTRPGHSNENFVPAMREFGLID
ncbi:nitrate reductase associated protein [Steroidobacter sp.]|uniref:nitrate reductase associated protein n=1 Tax=Steroidobacter sp. TaxID=1978227 RepID=UPI001A4FF821|nr:nitrate reductase associated protein [Steroidobacter sp.]MBL8268692.1 nitrate reductase associated protein [Steroidobacter sp.]